MVNLVHVRGDQHIAEQFIQLAGHAHIGVGQLGEQGGKGLVQHHHAHGNAGHEDGQDGEGGAENTLTRMMTQGGGHIHFGIRVVNNMKAPHKGNAVFHPVYQPGANKIEQQYP